MRRGGPTYERRVPGRTAGGRREIHAARAGAPLSLGVWPGRFAGAVADLLTTGRPTGSLSVYARTIGAGPLSRRLARRNGHSPACGLRWHGSAAWICPSIWPPLRRRDRRQGYGDHLHPAQPRARGIRLASGPFGVQQLRVTRPAAAGSDAPAPSRRPGCGAIVAGDPQAVRGLQVRLRTDPVRPWTLPASAAGLRSSATIKAGSQSRDRRGDACLLGRFPLGPPLAHSAARSAAGPARDDDRDDDPPQARGTDQRRRPGDPSGRPVAGVGVASHGPRTPLAPADAEGRFSAYLVPGIALAYPVGRAPRLLQPHDLRQQPTVARGRQGAHAEAARR